LVIEDDQSIAEIVGILLRGEGFEVSYCADGLQAITAFQAVSPDLVLLDLMLPGRDGIDVCRAIRETSGVPIVMLTARSDSADIVTGLESGADDYIVKPIKNEELLARIRALTSHPYSFGPGPSRPRQTGWRGSTGDTGCR
jgi:two-component system response regulator MtrA